MGAGVLETAAADRIADRLRLLADNALAQVLFHVEQLLGFCLQHVENGTTVQALTTLAMSVVGVDHLVEVQRPARRPPAPCISPLMVHAPGGLAPAAFW